MKYIGNKIVYEVGDWVRYKNPDTGFTDVFQAKAVGKYIEGGSKLGIVRGAERFRPATQEEIDKATKEQPIMVGDYKVDFGNGARGEQLDFIKVGCVTVGRLAFLEIKEKAGW